MFRDKKKKEEGERISTFMSSIHIITSNIISISITTVPSEKSSLGIINTMSATFSSSMSITPIATSNTISISITNHQSYISKVFSRYLHSPGSHQSTRFLELLTDWHLSLQERLVTLIIITIIMVINAFQGCSHLHQSLALTLYIPSCTLSLSPSSSFFSSSSSSLSASLGMPSIIEKSWFL